MLSSVYRESSKAMEIKRESRKIPKQRDQERDSRFFAIHTISTQTPDQQNEIFLALRIQIQRSQKTPSECVK